MLLVSVKILLASVLHLLTESFSTNVHVEFSKKKGTFSSSVCISDFLLLLCCLNLIQQQRSSLKANKAAALLWKRAGVGMKLPADSCWKGFLLFCSFDNKLQKQWEVHRQEAVETHPSRVENACSKYAYTPSSYTLWTPLLCCQLKVMIN